MRSCSILLLIMAVVAGLTCQPRPRQDGPAASRTADGAYEEIVSHPFDATWSALEELIAARSWRTNETSRSTGFVSLGSVPVADDPAYFACGSGRRESYTEPQASMTVAVERVTSSGTRVRISTQIDARDSSGRYSGRVKCKSTGRFEQDLVKAIDSVIVARRQM